MKKKCFSILLLLVLSYSLFSNILMDFYHSNYGPVERLVFVFTDYPNKDIREFSGEINISFFDCTINPQLKTQNFENQEVIKRITFVRVDDFAGIVLDTYGEYKIESQVLHPDEDYKLVIDVFRYVKPPSPGIALKYADFYKKMGFPEKSFKNLQIADSLDALPPKIDIPEIKPLASLEKEKKKVKIKEEEQIKEDTLKDTSLTANSYKERFKQKSFLEKVLDAGRRIVSDRVLLYSLIFLAAIIIFLIILAVVRKLNKKRKTVEIEKSESFGTEEFQRLTIKRLLANGWQVQEIAQELNLSVEDVEEFGRST